MRQFLTDHGHGGGAVLTKRKLMLGGAGLACSACLPWQARSSAMEGADLADAFSLDDLARRTFNYFLELADARTGLVPDRWPTPSFASIAAVGFALTAYPYGVMRGWVTRAEARERTLTTMRFFATAPQGTAASGMAGHNGFFYHFLDMQSGTRFGTCELSTIDTALLVAGVLFAGQYFDHDEPQETEIRALADAIYARVDWQWALGSASFMSMGWHPESGFIASQWDIYNEAMILHMLALGSPTHAVDPALWGRLTGRFAAAWGRHWGEDYIHFPAMLAHQYSHVWIDFRGIQDAFIRARGIDYFENSRRATIAQRNYAITNAGAWTGYGPDIWGWNACDGPGDFAANIGGRRREFFSYSARGPGDRDDGTITPSAAGGSIAFAPELASRALRTMHDRYGRVIYGQYGFFDSFNPTLADASGIALRHGRIEPGLCWVDGDYLGLDQGPIISMIANGRDDFVWRHMRANPHIRRGLAAAGFGGGWLG